MHKLLNFFCFPLLIVGLIFLSNGFIGYNSLNSIITKNNSSTSSQINSLYSEKEIILKDPPVSEKLSKKLFVKVRFKPVNPSITSKIKNNINPNVLSNLSDTDYAYLKPSKRKFVKTVLPIIINENQNILITRSFISDIKIKLETFKTLNNKEIRKLNSIAEKYNIAYSNKHKLDTVEEILTKVDVIPNSIVLAQAAIESGWGSSRFAREHNALFGEYTYDNNKGVIPLNRENGDKHLIKSFNSFNSSVESYFKNINTHLAYEDFREIRKVMRERKNFSNVNILVEQLNTYAEDENYISTIKAVIKKNKFKIFDSKTIIY